MFGFNWLKKRRNSKRQRRARMMRNYTAATQSRLTADWLATGLAPDAEVKTSFPTLRNRARERERNDDYARSYLRAAETNVVGSEGVRLQNKARNATGDLDQAANDQIEGQWKQWGKVGNCTADGRKSWIDCQRLVVRSIERDGEAIIRILDAFDNDSGFAIQFIEPDLLDDELNAQKTKDRGTIRMGIELDEWGRPLNYWFFTQHPGDNVQTHMGKRYAVIPASQIIHIGYEERQGQVRYVSSFSSAMTRLNHLDNYEEAEVVAARAGAAKMGFYITSDDYQGDDEDSDGNPIQEAEPGIFEVLPDGISDFKPWDPQHPTTAFPSFVKAILRGIAAGLGVSYNKLAGDLEGVNFSSLRAGELAERDTWKMKQTWLIEHFITPIFSRWLLSQLARGRVTGGIAAFDRLNNPLWIARKWAWVDPKKDVEAEILMVEAGFKSQKQAILDQGNDPETIQDDNAAMADDTRQRLQVVAGLIASRPETENANEQESAA